MSSVKSNGSHIALVKDKTAKIYSWTPYDVSLVSDFKISSSNVELFGEHVFIVTNDFLETWTIKGEKKNEIPMQISGKVAATSLNGKYIVIVVEDGTVLVFDIGRRTPKLASTSKLGLDYAIQSVSISRNGSIVSFMTSDFGIYLHSPQSSNTVKVELPGQPVSHIWASDSTFMLCIQLQTTILPIYVDPDLAITPLRSPQIPQDKVIFRVETPRIYYSPDPRTMSTVSSEGSILFAVVPHLYSLDGLSDHVRKQLASLDFLVMTERSTEDVLSEFVSLEQTQALIRYSIGNGRFQCPESFIYRIKNEDTSIAESPENVVSRISSQTMVDKLTKVSDICQDNDKLNKQANEYLVGLKALQNGDTTSAYKSFELLGCSGIEILKQAMKEGRLDALIKTANSTNASSIVHTWMGRYYEAKGNTDMALMHFEMGGDTREIIRVLFIANKIEAAMAKALQSESKSIIIYACKLLEQAVLTSEDTQFKDKYSKLVIELYSKYKMHGAAFDFSLRIGRHTQLEALAIGAPPTVVAKAARLFEQSDDLRKSVLLWMKVGRQNRALTLCIKNRLVDILDEIADTIATSTDKSLLISCGDLMLEENHKKSAANYFCLGGDFDKAIDICKNNEVKINKSLLESIATKTDNIEKLAVLCEQQKVYLTAAQLYVRLEKSQDAIRNLASAGEIDKIVKYANLIKDKDVYLIAADSLRQFKTKSDSPLFNTIIQFYQRSLAYDKIALYLEMKGQSEIDEFQNYDKALELLNMANQAIAKLNEFDEKIVTRIQKKIRLVEMYLEASKSVNKARIMELSNELLKHEKEECVRFEDVYMLIVQVYLQEENFSMAVKVLENMRKSGVDLTWFLEEESLKRIYRQAGFVYVNQEDDGFDEIPDDIEEPMSDDI